MELGAGEEVGVLVEQVVDDLRGLRLGDVDGAAGGRALRVAQLEVGVGGDHGAEVAGRVDLGDDRDVARGGEIDDLLRLGLGQVLVRDDLGVRVGLDAEGLVVGEVQAQLVELQVAQLPDPVLDPVGAVVLAGDVEGEAALRFGRLVLHHALRRGAAAVDRLLQGAGAVVDAGFGGPGDGDPAVAHGHGVRLRVRALVGPDVEQQVPGALVVLLPGVRHAQLARDLLALVGEPRVGDDDPVLLLRLPAGAAGRGVLAHGGYGARLLGQRVGPAGAGSGRLTGGRPGRRPRWAAAVPVAVGGPEADSHAERGDHRAGDHGPLPHLVRRYPASVLAHSANLRPPLPSCVHHMF
ncbi:hypothetical protein RKD37_003864 [Streptomyces ambofaciens]